MRVFMFKTGGLGDEYGIGSYIKSIVKASSGHALSVNFFIIDLQITSIIEKIRINRKKNITYCTIPATFNGINTYADALFPNAVFTTLCGIFDINSNDIFHFNTGMQFSLAKKIKDELNATIIYTVHFLVWKSMYQNHDSFINEFRKKTFKNKLMSVHQEQELCRISNKVIAMNSETLSYLKQVYHIHEKRILILPNGLPRYVDIEIAESVAVIKKRLGLQDKKIILYVGRIHPEKGVFDLIEAFKKVIAINKDVKLVIIGDGAISQAISLCSGFWNDVMFTGFIKDKKQLMEFYKIADLMVLTSYHEQSSFTFLEGLQHKKPLILSAIPAFEKLDENSCKKISFIKKRGTEQLVINKKQLFNALCQLINDKHQLNNLANNAYNTFNEEFNLDVLYNRLISDAYKISVKIP